MLGVDRCSDVIRNHRRATSRSRDRHDALERRTTDPSRYSVMSVANAKLAGNQDGARGAAVRAQFARVAPRGGGPSSPANPAGRRNGAGFSNAAGRPVPSCSRQRNCASVATRRRHPAPGTPKRTAFNAAACGEGFVGFVGAMLAASPNICLTHASGTDKLDCAHFCAHPLHTSIARGCEAFGCGEPQVFENYQRMGTAGNRYEWC